MFRKKVLANEIYREHLDGVSKEQRNSHLKRQRFLTTNSNLCSMHGKKARLGPQGRLPGLVISFMGSILRTATMVCHLPAHRRRSALQTFGSITKRRAEATPREMSSR